MRSKTFAISFRAKTHLIQFVKLTDEWIASLLARNSIIKFCGEAGLVSIAIQNKSSSVDQVLIFSKSDKQKSYSYSYFESINMEIKKQYSI